MGIIESIFKIPKKIVLFFIKGLWFLISTILNLIWNEHMISIWDYFNAWTNPNPFSYIPRIIRSIIGIFKKKLSWKSNWYKILNLLSLGQLAKLDTNHPDPKPPLILEGAFYFCHLVIIIGMIMLMMKFWRFIKKFEK
jgi:hypothetical protein